MRDTYSKRWYNIRKTKGKVYMHPCLLVTVVYRQAGGYLFRQDGENGVTWTYYKA